MAALNEGAAFFIPASGFRMASSFSAWLVQSKKRLSDPPKNRKTSRARFME
jgi:hypothetical protein